MKMHLFIVKPKWRIRKMKEIRHKKNKIKPKKINLIKNQIKMKTKMKINNLIKTKKERMNF